MEPAMERPRISAVTLVRNEEANLAYCLKTLQWCDEIVVVDMESEDRTVEIAKQYTKHILSHEKVLSFDIGRVCGIEKASGEWILIIDADEMIPYPLARQLRDIAMKNEVDIVEVPFKHYLLGDCVRYTGWGYTPMPRFFRKGKIQFTPTIHAYMHKADDAVIVQLPCKEEACIEHFNYRDSSHFIEKLNKYTSIEAQHLFDRKERFSYRKLLVAAFREFRERYFRAKGYKEGVRGFSLAFMMFVYRALSYIKLWEKYEFREDPVSARYERIRQHVLEQWRVESRS
jgi:glycosyltransferase involved in cell wall biosynthesis